MNPAKLTDSLSAAAWITVNVGRSDPSASGRFEMTVPKPRALICARSDNAICGATDRLSVSNNRVAPFAISTRQSSEAFRKKL